MGAEEVACPPVLTTALPATTVQLMPAPICLTDSQLAVIMAAAEPLAVADRDPFLRDVAARLQGGDEIGDGFIHRVIAEVQARYWHPPDLSRNAGTSKWR